MFGITSVPDCVVNNDESPPWVTVQVSQNGNGMLCFNTATAIEAYEEEINETVEVVDEEATAKAKLDAAAAAAEVCNCVWKNTGVMCIEQPTMTEYIYFSF